MSQLDLSSSRNRVIAIVTPGKELQSCCRLLSADDADGASTINGAGWNKFDSAKGHAYATTDQADWNDEEARAVFRMLRKYSKQLEAMGVDWEEIDSLYSYLSPW